MVAYDTFKLWYSKGTGANNTFALADGTRKIQNVTTPAKEEISLIYCLPGSFVKRATDVSEALAVDPTSPDTGTGSSNVILRFTQKREQTPTIPVLAQLLEMFYLKSSDDIYLKGRFGLENTDNPQLDVLPLPSAGYKFLSYKQEPNQNNPALLIYEITLKFVGDHTKLGTRS